MLNWCQLGPRKQSTVDFESIYNILTENENVAFELPAICVGINVMMSMPVLMVVQVCDRASLLRMPRVITAPHVYRSHKVRV